MSENTKKILLLVGEHQDNHLSCNHLYGGESVTLPLSANEEICKLESGQLIEAKFGPANELLTFQLCFHQPEFVEVRLRDFEFHQLSIFGPGQGGLSENFWQCQYITGRDDIHTTHILVDVSKTTTFSPSWDLAPFRLLLSERMSAKSTASDDVARLSYQVSSQELCDSGPRMAEQAARLNLVFGYVSHKESPFREMCTLDDVSFKLMQEGDVPRAHLVIRAYSPMIMRAASAAEQRLYPTALPPYLEVDGKRAFIRQHKPQL